jgi:hypothetical protein
MGDTATTAGRFFFPPWEGGVVPRQDAKQLSPEERQEVFRALVEAQDASMTVPQSRKATAERFGLSEAQVRQIEREGLDGQWPPLG